MKAVAFVLLLSGCASFRAAEVAAWRKHGACSVVCDYAMGYSSTSNTLDPFRCSCYSPQRAAFDSKPEGLKLDEPAGVVLCCEGCRARAEAILKRQPWRRAYAEPFDDPFEDGP